MANAELLWLRALAASLLCGLLGLACGGRAIAWLQRRFREPIKSISPTVVRLHSHKAQTPTMGGLFLVVGLLLGTVAFGNLQEPRVVLAVLAASGFAALGAIDDLVKLRTERRGISAKAKLLGQFCVAVPAIAMLAYIDGMPSAATLVLQVLILCGAANAVNVTDGLDGLAAGCGLIAAATTATLLAVIYQGELAVPLAALAGSLLAFLWFNRHPAKVFMGDTGSQAIGGLLAFVAIAAGQELLFALVGGVFLVELASVLIQWGSYRLRGRRFFLCAPLHHHFQFAGWQEPGIVRRFWAAAIVCSLAGATLHRELPKNLANPSGIQAENLSTGSRVTTLTSAGTATSRPGFASIVQPVRRFP